MSLVMWTFQNDLGFSLCAVLSICHMVTTSDDWIKSKRKLSTNSSMLPLNIGDQVQ